MSKEQKPQKEKVLCNKIETFKFPYTYSVHTKMYSDKEHKSVCDCIASAIDKHPMDIYQELNKQYPKVFVSVINAGQPIFQVFDII